MSGKDIVALTGQTIGPSNVLRVSPWGSDPANDAANTELVSINNSVISQLAAGDVRKNYVMIGNTWTIGGAAPAPDGSNQVGTKQLANTTMETFFQPSNCFSCHTTNKFGVSHIYLKIKPLF